MKQQTDLLNGKIWNKVLLFALPLAAGSILQQIFNAADVAVAGHFAGEGALAAVGANGPIINLLVNLFVGLSVGTNVVISVCLGRKDMERIKKAVHTSILIALISGGILLILGQLFSGEILRIMSTPSDIFEGAEKYLKIYFLGMPFIMLYNFEAAVFRSRGDVKLPLAALSAAGVINIFLNLFFVIVCRMGVAGVAVATVISNVISSFLLLYFLLRETGEFKLDLRSLRIDREILISVAKTGVPAGMQGVVFSLSNVCIQSALNALGSDYVAGCTAALNFEIIVYYILTAFNQTAVTFIGQNYGAGKYARCRQTTRWIFVLGMAATVLLSLFFIVFRGTLVRIFTPDADVVRIACARIAVILPFELLNFSIEVLSGILRGLGHSAAPAVVCVAGICGVRILYLYTFYPLFTSFAGLMAIYPISWGITAAVLFVIYLRTAKRSYTEMKS